MDYRYFYSLSSLNRILFVIIAFGKNFVDSTKTDSEVKDGWVKFGGDYDGVESSYVHFGCVKAVDERRVCCDATNTSVRAISRGVGVDYDKFKNQQAPSSRSSFNIRARYNGGCTLTKEYISSPLELRHLEEAKRLYKIPNHGKRLHRYLEFVYSPEEIGNAKKWLKRVELHMQSEVTPPATPDDFDFLSRFEYKLECGGGVGDPARSSSNVTTWREWIEPVTVVMRHPFGFSDCDVASRYAKSWNFSTLLRNALNTDYIILQSGAERYRQMQAQSLSSRRCRGMSSSVSTKDGLLQHCQQGQGTGGSSGRSTFRGTKQKHYFLEAGASTFDSSMNWFTCGYSQRKISFDRVFAWEKTILDPFEVWRRVPTEWKPYVTYFNIPISADQRHTDSLWSFVKRIANPHDFVSVKLDIDHPDTELAIAMELMHQADSIYKLVDEFFLEVHYSCEVMTTCGWDTPARDSFHGLTLDRPTVMQYFINLRQRGIRAHVWP